MIFRVELPWPPRGLSPNARLTVFAKAKLFKATKIHTRLKTAQAMKKAVISEVQLKEGRADRRWKGGTMNVRLICTPPLNRYRDEDNLIANCKAIFDGAAEALGVDDSTFHFREQVWNEPEKPGALAVVFDWEEPDE